MLAGGFLLIFVDVVDAYAGADPNYRLKIRVVTSRAYHALFMNNMLIRPTPEELESFGQPDFTIYNAGQFPANKLTKGLSSPTSVALSFDKKEMVILGSEYAGEMKKGYAFWQCVNISIYSSLVSLRSCTI